jgi:quercetin dioxygenase-like cupin family protein
MAGKITRRSTFGRAQPAAHLTNKSLQLTAARFLAALTPKRKTTMNKMKLKQMSAGVLVACALGGIALKFAGATPSLDFTGMLVSGPVLLEEIDAKGETETHEIELKTRGDWTGRIMQFHIAPGGHTGWHSHPGPVFVMVTKGTLTLTQADDPDNPVEYPEGTGFVEDPGRVHIAENRGDVDLDLDAFIWIPLGAAVRVDEDGPEPQL